MMTDRDDALLDALGSGQAIAEGDDLAVLFAAWHTDISDIDPAILRSPIPEPETVEVAQPRSRRRFLPRIRFSRPLVVSVAAAAVAFGGLTAASATAGPDSPFWPITRIVFGDTADSRLAEQEAQRLLEQAKLAMAGGRPAEAAQLVGAAREKIALIADDSARQRLEAEAAAILTQVATLPEPVTSAIATPTSPPVAGTPPAAGTSQPTPEKTGLLPPILPSLLPSPSALLPCLPLLCS